jgi:hypothetical protein
MTPPDSTSTLAKAMRQGQTAPSVQRRAGAVAAGLHATTGNQPPMRSASSLAKILQTQSCRLDALRVARPAIGKLAKSPQTQTSSSKPDIISRAGWGAAAPNLSRGYEPITGDYCVYYDIIVLHHSGNRINYPTMRGAQDHNMKEGYADIAYHFGIDINGRIYEGRPLWIKGAHVKGHHTGIGIVLLADLDTENSGLGYWEKKAESLMGDGHLSQAMRASLINLILYLRSEYQISRLAGHKEVLNERNCPGDIGLKLVEQLRQAYHFKP